MEQKRVDKVNYYLSIAEAVAGRGTCLRKNYGCIIVKNDEIIATGYTGAPRRKTKLYRPSDIVQKRKYFQRQDMEFMQNKMQ